MGLKKWSKKAFSRISNYKYILCTYNYYELLERIENNHFSKEIQIKDYYSIISGYAFKSSDYISKGIKVCRIGDLSKTQEVLVDNMESLPEEYKDKYQNYIINNGDVLIGLTGDGTYFKTAFVDNLNECILLNQRVSILRKKSDGYESKLLNYILQTKYSQNQLKIVAMGKTQKNISPFDVLKIKIPYFNKEEQQKILNQIKPIESEIEKLKSSKIKEIDIINKVFGKELGLDWEKFENLKKIKQYASSLSQLSNNIDCRMSYNFHNQAEEYLWDFMVSKTDKRVKNFIAEPIVLGESVSPEQYDEEGEYYYIAMCNIKNWKFELDDCKTVKKIYSDKAIKKGKLVKKGDIILARSGEGTIGKVALINDDVNAVFADFTQRIRLKNYNPLCAYYYFRSDIFQYFIYSFKKGMGNNTNIFPKQVQEFLIPDWTLEKQSEIANKIKTQIDAQNEIDKKILEKQNEISAIIEKATF